LAATKGKSQKKPEVIVVRTADVPRGGKGKKRPKVRAGSSGTFSISPLLNIPWFRTHLSIVVEMLLIVYLCSYTQS